MVRLIDPVRGEFVKRKRGKSGGEFILKKEDEGEGVDPANVNKQKEYNYAYETLTIPEQQLDVAL